MSLTQYSSESERGRGKCNTVYRMDNSLLVPLLSLLLFLLLTGLLGILLVSVLDTLLLQKLTLLLPLQIA